MTQIHSDWNELRELSHGDRINLITNESSSLSGTADYFTVYDDRENKWELYKDLIKEAQQHLDRIKALVMSRGKE